MMLVIKIEKEERKMKKSILCILVLAMVLVFAACNKNETEQKAETTPTETIQETTPEPTEEVTPEVTVEPTEEVTPEVTAEPTEETTPEVTEEPTEEVTPEATAEPTEEVTPEPTEDPEPTEEPEIEVDALGNASYIHDIDKSEMIAQIVGYYEFVGDNYIAIIDFYDQFMLTYDEIVDKKAGDVVELNGSATIVKGFYTMDEQYDFSILNDSYVEGSRMVVIPENPEELFPKSQMDDMGYDDDPEYYAIGFVSFDGEGTFYGFTDWAWDDCYVPATYVTLPMVKLVVTPDTVAQLAYCFTEEGHELVKISGTDYLKLREDEEGQEERGIHIYPSTDVYIEEILDDSGRSTGEISMIKEIYMP